MVTIDKLHEDLERFIGIVRIKSFLAKLGIKSASTPHMRDGAITATHLASSMAQTIKYQGQADQIMMDAHTYDNFTAAFGDDE